MSRLNSLMVFRTARILRAHEARTDARGPEEEELAAMLRIIALVLILVMAPTVAFFLWAWGVKIKEQRKIAGTLPEWQDLPLTWLAIAGLACTIIGFVVMFFTQNQGYGGLFAP